MAEKEESSKEIIASLARQFYTLGWFPGSGGSLTIRESPDRIFIAPSGVQKERIKAEDVFIIDRNAEVIQGFIETSDIPVYLYNKYSMAVNEVSKYLF